MVWIFGKVSDQQTIKDIRERIRGNLIGVRLFQSDIRVVIQLQRYIFGDTLQYMKLALIPMIVLIIPVLIIMTQLNLRFAVRPMEPGQTALVKAFVRDPSVLEKYVSLETASGLTVETPGVRIPSTREVAWRVRADVAGMHQVVVHVGEETIAARLVSGNRWDKVVQRRTGRGVWDTLLYPGEDPIPLTHSVEAIEIVYPQLELRAFGFTIHWLVAFFIISIAAGFACKDMLGVEV